MTAISLSALREHTPGPWKMDGRLVIDTRGDAVAMTNIARAVDIAHCDARLIAAAPQLLPCVDALQKLIALHSEGKRAELMIENRDIEEIMRWKSRWDAAFAAARKAAESFQP